MDQAIEFLNQNKSVIVTVLGFVWMVVAKAVSNEKASPVIAGMQKGLDIIAKVAKAVGTGAQIVSDILAEAIKSDGFLGKK